MTGRLTVRLTTGAELSLKAKEAESFEVRKRFAIAAGIVDRQCDKETAKRKESLGDMDKVRGFKVLR